MENISLVQLFITLFIGMGPIKVLLIYIALTQNMDKAVRRKIAQRTVLVAGVVGVGLFVFGAILQAILHFSIGALTIIGGLILLLLALKMVLGDQGGSSGGHGEAVDPMSLAVSPLAIPLTLNPVGIVTLVVASVEVQSLVAAGLIIGMILIIMAIDLGVLYASDRIAAHLSQAAVELLEKVLGIFLGALAVQLMLDGLAELGIITMTTGH